MLLILSKIYCMKLKNILLLNGISSGLTGLLLLLFSSKLSDLFNLMNNQYFIFVGGFLVLFSIYVCLTAMKLKQNLLKVKSIVVLDLAWVIGSVVIIGFGYHTISWIGIVLIIGIAIWVGTMALLQHLYLKKELI